MTLYGFYSKQAEEMVGKLFVYEKEDGSEVSVTTVTTERSGYSYKFPDKVFMGIVVRYIRTITVHK